MSYIEKEAFLPQGQSGPEKAVYMRWQYKLAIEIGFYR